MADKQAIRPIYSELQGYLKQAPEAEQSSIIYKDEIWNQCNAAINELEEVTNKVYTRFKIVPERGYEGKNQLTTSVYRHSLGGIIARLHGEYFYDEPAPFAGMPTTVINQHQNQQQSVEIQIQQEIKNLIEEKLKNVKEGSPEKTFLEKIKGGLSTVKNISEFVTMVIGTAKTLGIPIEQLASLFS